MTTKIENISKHYLRTGNETNGHLEICPHIILVNTHIDKNPDGAEYIETSHICCMLCNKFFEINTLIN